MTSEEIDQFAERHNLVYSGESSALSDTNIKEVVEALLESKVPSHLSYRNTFGPALSGREACVKYHEAEREILTLGLIAEWRLLRMWVMMLINVSSKISCTIITD